MRLNKVKVGQAVIIKEVDAKCNCTLRIMTLGLIEGTKVKVISSTRDNIEVLAYNSKYAISKHCASFIVV